MNPANSTSNKDEMKFVIWSVTMKVGWCKTYIDGLAQDFSISSALAMETMQSYTKSLIWSMITNHQ